MKIAILGYGVVGKGVEELAAKAGIEVKYLLMREIDPLTKPTMVTDYEKILADPEVDAVVECIGGLEPAHTFVWKALNAKKPVVTSNKKMLVHFFKELVTAARENQVSLLFSASCGGGIPWITELSRVAKADTVSDFSGIMNGTSNYILHKMYTEGTDFQEALRKAQELGFAEADPSDDIDGIDTANKTVLSATIAFQKEFALEDVAIHGIRNITKEEFDFAKKNQLKIVLLGHGERLENGFSLTVLPTFVPISSTLGSVMDNYNCFTLSSYALQKLSFIGQGAGSLPTASNILRDLLSLENPYPVIMNERGLIHNAVKTGTFYFRTCRGITIREKMTLSEAENFYEQEKCSFMAEVKND